jgi:HSP20 family molecular chaperone IbpA
VRRVFDEKGGASLGGRETWFQAERELLHRIALSVVETEEAFKVKAEVPSFKEEKIEASVEPRCLMIEGKCESKKEETRSKTVCAEGRSDQIFVEMSAEVGSEKVTATLRNVLELTVLKVAKAQRARMHPNAASSELRWQSEGFDPPTNHNFKQQREKS